MNEELLSAHLDGELTDAEAAQLEAAFEADADLRRTYDELARVRAVLRGASVVPSAGAMDRIVAHVAAADSAHVSGRDDTLAPVVTLTARRRIPTLAAVAAAIVIIASVVGGVGGTTSLPAIGDLIAQHEATASVAEGGPMPAAMEDMEKMPMNEAAAVGPAMPANYTMQLAFVDGPTVQLVYVAADGEPVSIFRHAGEVDMEDLGSGSITPSAEGDMWSGPLDEAYVAVVDGTGYVWVVISDTPRDDMMDDMMNGLPTRSPSLGERLRRAADAVAEPFRFGD